MNGPPITETANETVEEMQFVLSDDEAVIVSMRLASALRRIERLERRAYVAHSAINAWQKLVTASDVATAEQLTEQIHTYAASKRDSEGLASVKLPGGIAKTVKGDKWDWPEDPGDVPGLAAALGETYCDRIEIPVRYQIRKSDLKKVAVITDGGRVLLDGAVLPGITARTEYTPAFVPGNVRFPDDTLEEDDDEVAW